jgi:hypothetical protein
VWLASVFPKFRPLAARSPIIAALTLRERSFVLDGEMVVRSVVNFLSTTFCNTFIPLSAV